jgi:hypothetical protein
MPTLKYVGTSHFRKISKNDFKALDIDQDAIELARHDLPAVQNPKGVPAEVEVSDAAAEWLTKNEPKDWKVVEKAEESSGDNALDGDATGNGETPASGNRRGR